MEIEFNPSQVTKMEFSQPIGRRGTTSAASDSTAFFASSSMATFLQDKLNATPLVRQDSVDQAMQLASDEHYPPDDVEERIAVLLALHIKH
jgi:hypothetical protein